MALKFSHYRELGMLGSPGMDSLSGASDMKYPGDCYSPKYVDQRDTYRGKRFLTVSNIVIQGKTFPREAPKI